MNNIDRTKLLTPKELSERWGGLVTTATLANWRARRRKHHVGLPYVKLGGKVVYDIQDIEKYEEKTLRK